MNAYERQVLREWVQEDKSAGNLPDRLIRSLTGRVRRVFAALDHPKTRPWLDRGRDIARSAVIRSLEHGASARRFAQVEKAFEELRAGVRTPLEIRMLPLEVKDAAAGRGHAQHLAATTVEGVAAGAAASLCELVPGLQPLLLPTMAADLALTFQMMANAAVSTAYAYGYSAANPEDMPHLLFSMAPHTGDLALAEAKLAAHAAVRQAGASALHAVGESLTARALYSSQPAVRALVDAVAARLAAKLAERDLSLLLPVAGAVLQGGVNAAFAARSHRLARRYFQRLHLVDRYGEDYLDEQLARANGHSA